MNGRRRQLAAAIVLVVTLVPITINELFLYPLHPQVDTMAHLFAGVAIGAIAFAATRGVPRCVRTAVTAVLGLFTALSFELYEIEAAWLRGMNELGVEDTTADVLAAVVGVTIGIWIVSVVLSGCGE